MLNKIIDTLKTVRAQCPTSSVLDTIEQWTVGEASLDAITNIGSMAKAKVEKMTGLHRVLIYANIYYLALAVQSAACNNKLQVREMIETIGNNTKTVKAL